MQAQLKKILVPREFSGDIIVTEIFAAVEMRVYREDVLFTLSIGGHPFSLRAPYHGWVKYLAVKEGQSVAANELLLVLSVFDREDYRPDGTEVNLQTELGDAGRRGLEREGQRKFAAGYDKALFDAPAGGHGAGFNQLPPNPLLDGMKQGVPPKMNAQANQNNPAVDHFAEEAGTNPELQNQLSHELKQQMNIQPTLAPTPSNKPL